MLYKRVQSGLLPKPVLNLPRFSLASIKGGAAQLNFLGAASQPFAVGWRVHSWRCWPFGGKKLAPTAALLAKEDAPPAVAAAVTATVTQQSGFQ